MGPLTTLGWRADALCQQRSPEEFVPSEKKTTSGPKTLCAMCPVRDQCLEFALSSPWEPYGIWAGMGRKELLPKWKERRAAGECDRVETYLGIAGVA